MYEQYKATKRNSYLLDVNLRTFVIVRLNKRKKSLSMKKTLTTLLSN